MAKSRRKPRPQPGDKLNKLLSQGEFNDEQLDEALLELTAGMSAEQIMDASRLFAAQAFNVAGFSAFYRLIHGNDLPAHARQWVEDIFRVCAAEEKLYEGVVLWAWRGSWKSTTISVTLTAFFVGHHPELTNLIIGANDDSAEKLAAAVARIIELHPAWQLVFPYVVPDKDKGWGAEGYSVWDSRMGKEAWTQKTSSTIDPTFLGAGYNSSRLIGKHPTGMLLIDDIHDEKNSISARERETVVRVVAETIRRVCAWNGWTPMALQVMPDHVHFFVSAPPKWAPAQVVGSLKAWTSRDLRQRFSVIRGTRYSDDFWASSYYCGTAGHVSAEAVARYIRENSGR